MKFSISKAALMAELALVVGVTERKPTIPILSNVLLDAKDGWLRITGTDLDVTLQTLCAAAVDVSGACCLSAKKLSEVVRNAPDGEITFSGDPGEHIQVTYGRSRFKLLSLAAENFPDVAKPAGEFLPIPGSQLARQIERVAFAITLEESRYTLNGAKMEIAGGVLRLVATDGHRLAFTEEPLPGAGDAKLDVLIPRKALSEMQRLIGGNVELAVSENQLFVRAGERLLVSRLLSGQFPNYELVLPKDNNHHATMAAADLAAAIRRAGLMADERSRTVKLDFSDGRVAISAASDAGECADEMPVAYVGPDIALAVNSTYFLDALGCFPGDVVLRMKDARSRVELCAPDAGAQPSQRQVVMPMRV